MKAVSTSTLGMSGALSTANPACSTRGLCRRPTLPISPSMAAPSLRLSLICAVVLMSSRARCTCASLALTLRPPIRSALFSLSAIQRAALLEAAALAQRKHAGAARAGGEEGVGMDADEQVGLHPPGLLHAHLQRHKKIGVAREEGAHRVAVDGGGVDAVAQQVGHLEHHVFLARAARADGAGVFAAVAGVERDDDQAVGAGGGFGAFFSVIFAISPRRLVILCN